MRMNSDRTNQPSLHSKDPALESKVRDCMVSVGLTMLVLNAAGATLTFCYFAVVESELIDPSGSAQLMNNLWFFLAVLVVALAVFEPLTVRMLKPLAGELIRSIRYPHRASPRQVVGKVVNLPIRMAFVSLVGWLGAAACYAIAPLVINGMAHLPLHRALRAVFGILFIGAPFTAFFIYFALEWILRRAMRNLFAPGFLTSLPRSAKIQVLSKMLLVSLMLGTIPVSVISYVTLTQIHDIAAGQQSITSFVSQMPAVIVFLLSLAVVCAVGLSVALARSVSEPLRLVESAMEEVREGNLTVTIPVLANDEIGVMAEGFNRMVRGLQEGNYIRETFGIYLSSEVVEEILASPSDVHVGGELSEVTILVSDLRGFTALTSSMRPEVVVMILNRYLEKMVDIIMHHGGIIDEFTGDGILAFFGAPRRAADAPGRAVRAACEMQRAMPELNKNLLATIPELSQACNQDEGSQTADYDRTQPGPLRMGIGINSGVLVLGSFGSEKRKKYGAVGAAINIAFRVEKESQGEDILITSEVFEKVEQLVEAQAIPDVELKGVGKPVTLYRVLRFTQE